MSPAAGVRPANPAPSTVTGAATHAGRVRKANEDSYLVLPEAASGR